VNCACGSAAAVRAGYCRACWARQIGYAHRKYNWTPELRAELQAAYRGLRKRELSAALSKLERKTGWPRHAMKSEAIRMGIITGDHRRAWTAEETEYLAERLGVVSLKQIARRLGRSHGSVESRAEKMGLSRRVKEGYCLADLCALFGESYSKVKRWQERGLLGRVHAVSGLRVAEENVLQFIREHHCEYDLRRVDQTLFKAMVFEEAR